MQVTALYRHPIKAHGRETLDRVRLQKGNTMPYDRHWAIAHDSAKLDGSDWVSCANFSRAAKAPSLMAIQSTLDEATGEVTLTHPNQDSITVHPTRDTDQLIDWVRPLVPENRAMPTRVVEQASRGFTDSPFASVSMFNTASHHAVEALHQGPLSSMRWRGNIWFDGAEPWAEFDWINRDLRLGDAVVQIKEPITRCLATAANPDTGKRDEDVLRTLNILGHQDFGVNVEVTQGGDVCVGDRLELI